MKLVVYPRVYTTKENDPEIVDWKRVRSAMEHEEYLLFERAKLLTASQAFFFTAYSIISISDGIALNPIWYSLLVVISFSADCTSYFIAATMYEARHQHSKLEVWWISCTGDLLVTKRGKMTPKYMSVGYGI